ncbi:YIP1 family protein [Kurthia huakuii]|uniref:YIP1 family protein n=1 Tax=Kurthia huakuii TaxID=1421019 RepID=UPI0004981AB5|nr:YIP1 family protein [Kurthia huakuii]MBM7697766.1 hypothetical protein [Kurthia huakuii]
MNLALFKLAWKNPRAAVHYVNENGFSKYWFVLFLAGFGNIVFSGINDETSEIGWTQVLIAVIAAIPSVWLGAIIAGFFTHLIAKWFFKGTGTFKEMRKGYYISLLPYVIAAPVALIYVVLSKVATFNLDYFVVFMGLLLMVIGIVTIVLEVIVISEVEKLSIGRSIGVMVIMIIFAVLAIFFIVLIVTIILILLGVTAL